MMCMCVVDVMVRFRRCDTQVILLARDYEWVMMKICLILYFSAGSEGFVRLPISTHLSQTGTVFLSSVQLQHARFTCMLRKSVQ